MPAFKSMVTTITLNYLNIKSLIRQLAKESTIFQRDILEKPFVLLIKRKLKTREKIIPKRQIKVGIIIVMNAGKQ